MFNQKYFIHSNSQLCRRPTIVGQKAVVLANLIKFGFAVPPFTVIAADVFKQLHHCKSSGDANLINIIGQMPFGMNAFPNQFWQDFEHHIKKILANGPQLSIRSSSLNEDTARHSYAGHYETTLFIKDVESAWEAVKRCWISALNPVVSTYEDHTLNTPNHPEMAVIIQQMIQPQIAGVLFTRHPVTGSSSRMLIEAALNSPDDVSSGREAPIRITIDKLNQELIIERQNSKTDLQRWNDLLQELSRAALSIEKKFKAPQDIEWAIADNKLWLLQARPMTTRASNDRRRIDDSGQEWTDYFFVERFAEPVTPLGWAIVGRAIERRAFREPLSFLGYAPHGDLTCLFDYCPFTRTDVFQQLYSVVPDQAISSDKQDAFLAMPRQHHWLFQLIKRLPVLFVRLIIRDVNWFPPIHLRAWKRFIRGYVKQIELLQADLKHLSSDELKTHFLKTESLTDTFLSYHRWSITFADLCYHFLDRITQKLLIPGAAMKLLNGLPGNKTVEANRDLFLLADSARSYISNQSSDAWQHQPDFIKEFQRFLKQHGHRSRNLDPFYPTWADQPEFVLQMVQSRIEDPSLGEKFMANQVQLVDGRQHAETMLFNQIKTQYPIHARWMIPLLHYFLGLTHEFALLRENQRYYWHMALAVKRRIILECARRWNESFSSDDIFFLQRNEFLKR